MGNEQEQLINEIFDGLSNIDYGALHEEDIHKLLDGRDNRLFDEEWCRIAKEIEALKNGRNYTNEIKTQQEKIRERAFFLIEKNIEGEISEYVSDDFGLIYDALALNYRDEWLDKLIGEYRNGKIPAGKL